MSLWIDDLRRAGKLKVSLLIRCAEGKNLDCTGQESSSHFRQHWNCVGIVAVNTKSICVDLDLSTIDGPNLSLQNYSERLLGGSFRRCDKGHLGTSLH